MAARRDLCGYIAGRGVIPAKVPWSVTVLSVNELSAAFHIHHGIVVAGWAVAAGVRSSRNRICTGRYSAI